MFHEKYPELRRLFACKLNEGWPLDHPTADAALEAGIAGFWPHELHAAREEMNRLRADQRDPEALTSILRDELGVNYLWEVDGWEVREWLAHVASMLKQQGGLIGASPNRNG